MVLMASDVSKAEDRLPRVAVLLLCHEPPALVAQALRSPFFVHPALKVYIHYDGRRTDDERDQLAGLMPDGVQYSFVSERAACAWGDYSLVEATHRMMRAAIDDTAFRADHFVLVSASCVPIRPLSSLQEFLRRRQGIDFIQAVDVSRRRWVRGGLEKERYEFRFPFNYQSQRWAFERFTALQRGLGLRRRPPDDLVVHFGSQWFCLTRDTATAVATRLDEPVLRKFFESSWIPDEFAIQTLVMTVQRPERVAGHNLTYYEFDDQGRPLVLENGHFEHLMRQPFFFARKLSPHARALTEQVERHVAKPEQDLSYFARAGSPSGHYAKFLARASLVKAARARVATAVDPWRGIMDFNERPYVLLYGTSRQLVGAVARRMREEDPTAPVFDFVFDPLRLTPAGESVAWRGVQCGMHARRDHDPAGFAHELIHLDADRKTVMCVDPGVKSWPRDYGVWDPLATVVCCEPKGLGKLQRAEAALRDISAMDEPALFEQTASAAATPGWLPQDFFDKASREAKLGCRHVTIESIAAEDKDDTLRALRKAWQSIDARSYFAASESEAHARLFGESAE